MEIPYETANGNNEITTMRTKRNMRAWSREIDTMNGLIPKTQIPPWIDIFTYESPTNFIPEVTPPKSQMAQKVPNIFTNSVENNIFQTEPKILQPVPKPSKWLTWAKILSQIQSKGKKEKNKWKMGASQVSTPKMGTTRWSDLGICLCGGWRTRSALKSSHSRCKTSPDCWTAPISMEK